MYERRYKRQFMKSQFEAQSSSNSNSPPQLSVQDTLPSENGIKQEEVSNSESIYGL